MAKKKKSKNVPKKKVKIKYKNVFLFLLFSLIFFNCIKAVLQMPVRNISVKGNVYLKEDEIIVFADIQNYPPILSTFAPTIEKKLEKTKEISKAKVRHKNIFHIEITVEENTPLYFDSTKEKTILKNGEEIEKNYDVPILLNYIPEQKYKKYIAKMKLIQKNTMEKISEIKYNPNPKDDERFLLTMRDGNYVYVTLDTFDKINHYLEIMTKINRKFEGQKGILYLDAGGYFEVME